MGHYINKNKPWCKGSVGSFFTEKIHSNNGLLLDLCSILLIYTYKGVKYRRPTKICCYDKNKIVVLL